MDQKLEKLLWLVGYFDRFRIPSIFELIFSLCISSSPAVRSERDSGLAKCVSGRGQHRVPADTDNGPLVAGLGSSFSSCYSVHRYVNCQVFVVVAEVETGFARLND